jgi:hypothetical protein
MYAPKAAKYLRRKWRSSYPETEFGALASQTGYGQSLRLSLGLGFTQPLSLDFGQAAGGALAAWLGNLHAPQPDLFCHPFDAMPAGLPVWAGTQPAIPAGLGQQPPSTRLEFCPLLAAMIRPVTAPVVVGRLLILRASLGCGSAMATVIMMLRGKCPASSIVSITLRAI